MEAERKAAGALLRAFDPPISPDTPLRLEVNLYLPDAGEEAALHVALRVGAERLYVVRSIAAFLRALSKGESVSFGKGFTLDPSSMCFEQMDARLLAVLSEVEAAQRPCEAQGYRSPQNGKFMPLGAQTALRVLHFLRARPFRLVTGGDILRCDAIAREVIPLRCRIEEEGRGLLLTVETPSDVKPITPDCAFVRAQGRIVQTLAAQRRVLRALWPQLAEGRRAFHFQPSEVETIISEIMPQLEMGAEMALSDALAARVRREALAARVYIDREGARVVVRVLFQYGDTAIDPFSRRAPREGAETLLVRDAAAEFGVLDTLAQAGFHVREGRVYLEQAARVLRFLQEGVSALQKVAEVFASDDFRRMRPRHPQLSGRLALVGGALQLTVFDGDTPVEELVGLMQALRNRKRYFRLKDGGFLELSQLEGWEELAALVDDVAEMEPGATQLTAEETPAIALKAYRAAYLVSLLGASQLPIAVDEAVKETAAALTRAGEPCPESLKEVLRPYQERGFQWLQALHRMRMGGVLADDMGLGKTLQVIAALLWAKEREGAQPSLVVCPTSLVYNWQAEVRRFAPELRVCVISGGQRVRAARWGELKATRDMDVIITSYPLLRRDSNVIGDFLFRFAVLDEAQHVKNPQSLSAVAASRLRAQTRLALTGTPMENNPGELWSIFHFVLPGYLMSLPQFMRDHGDGRGANTLRGRIRPFLLRRLKADVLPELPDKIESRVLAEMTLAQRNVYAAAAANLRERVERVLAGKGMHAGRMEVLSAITQLRQICCHPALVMEGYEGSSGKLDALMEILGDALASGRRVLLFSQFTSMLAILRRALDAQGVKSLYLDGKTPVVNRIELVNRFNGGEGQVFLISLKAGGAGLNLTGADTVIHYDPWWNPAAEDQATDRAHRIGQQKAVQVIRLITRGTIEEQVIRLSERKRALFDAVVTAGEKLPSDMTEAEILALFT
ncbi:MAG: DEAD/DEAH box helicase [Oscillospiraceae bacterium]|jgi:superfamily II DNA or RNA helicase|nr:DEAD/DEAH box helicase [Oscillospiraceae bacterium]